MEKYRVILKGTGAIFGEFETRVQAANGRSQNHKDLERLRANLRANFASKARKWTLRLC